MNNSITLAAAAARNEIEKFARDQDGAAGDVEDLNGYCAIASFFLVMLGRKFGYYYTLVEGSAFDLRPGDLDCGEEVDVKSLFANHCWVQYGEKIIDITATQFYKDPVHIVDVGDENYWPLSQNNEARKNLKAEWPEEQNPYAYIKDLRSRVNAVALALS